MKRLAVYTAVFMAVIALSGLGASQSLNTAQNDLGDDVQAYSFAMTGLPSPAYEGEVDAEKEIEVEPDDIESFNISQEKAVETALEELGSEEWNLTSAEKDEGLYSLEFTAGESEAEVEVDGSTGNVVSLEGEVEYEPRDEATVQLKGFIRFEDVGKEVEVESESEDGKVDFTVTIKSENSSNQMRSIREVEEVDPGDQTASLEVVRDGDVVYSDEKQFNIPETEEDSEEEQEQERLQNMTREQLIEEVQELRTEVEQLKERVSDREQEREGPPEDIGNKPEPEPEPEDEAENETGEEDSSESDEENETGQGPQEAPGADNRPGFVNNLLGGLFG